MNTDKMEDRMNIDTAVIPEFPPTQTLPTLLARLRLMARNRESLHPVSSAASNERKKHRKVPSSPSSSAPGAFGAPSHELREIPPALVTMSDTLGDMISEELRDRAYVRDPALVAQALAQISAAAPAPLIPSAVHDHVDAEDELRAKFGVPRDIEILQVPMCTDVLDDIVALCNERNGVRPEPGHYMKRGQAMTQLEISIMMGQPAKYVLELLDAAMFMNVAFIVEFAKVAIFWKLMAAQGRDITGAGVDAASIDQALGIPTASRTVPTKPRARFRAK